MSFDQRTLARMATAIENRDPHALATLETLAPGHAAVIGITGPPGAGKSTLVSALAAALRAQDKTVAILAVDPTSRITGGALLGDRIRMQQHHNDPGIFIRSVATRGASGGLSRAIADLVRLMDAAGRDYVLIETVGVGQDEVDVASLAPITVVVLVPGMGDDVQAIKAGIMEVAAIFVINKSDLPGADRLALDLHAERPDAPIVRTVAVNAEGVDALLQEIETRREAPHHPPAPGPRPPAPVSETPREAPHQSPSPGPRPPAPVSETRREAPHQSPAPGPRPPAPVSETRREAPHQSPAPGPRPPAPVSETRREAPHHTPAPGPRPPAPISDARREAPQQSPSPIPHPPSPFSIDHLGIAVPSLDAALAFYQQLGLTVGHRETVAHEKVSVAMLPVGESRIELLEPTGIDSTMQKFLEKRGPGLHHVALRVPDLTAAVERLRACGARLLNEPRAGAGGHLYVFVHPASTGGVLLELIQEHTT